MTHALAAAARNIKNAAGKRIKEEKVMIELEQYRFELPDLEAAINDIEVSL